MESSSKTIIHKCIPKKAVIIYHGVIITKTPFLVDIMTLVSGTSKKNKLEGAVVFPFVSVVSYQNYNHRFLTHESIHVKQSFECIIAVFVLLAIPFLLLTGTIPVFIYIIACMGYWVLYLALFLYHRMFNSHQDAYLLNPFETEAYLFEVEHDGVGKSYLTKRKPFTWTRYIWDPKKYLNMVKKNRNERKKTINR